MRNGLQCSKEFERRLWNIRDVLYGAVQDITHQNENARLGTKKAYEELSGLQTGLRKEQLHRRNREAVRFRTLADKRG